MGTKYASDFSSSSRDRPTNSCSKNELMYSTCSVKHVFNHGSIDSLLGQRCDVRTAHLAFLTTNDIPFRAVRRVAPYQMWFVAADLVDDSVSLDCLYSAAYELVACLRSWLQIWHWCFVW